MRRRREEICVRWEVSGEAGGGIYRVLGGLKNLKLKKEK